MLEIEYKKYGMKITALGFISLILLGNFWFVFMIIKQPAPAWMSTAYVISIITTLLGGLFLLINFILIKLGLK